MIFLVDEFPENPKIVRAGGEAAWLFVCGIGYCNRVLTGGLIPKAHVARLTDLKRPSQLARRLLDNELWHEAGHRCERCPQPPVDSYVVHDYADQNESAERKREERSERARVGWEKRKAKELAGAGAGRNGRSSGDATAHALHEHCTPTAPCSACAVHEHSACTGPRAGERPAARAPGPERAPAPPPTPHPPVPVLASPPQLTVVATNGAALTGGEGECATFADEYDAARGRPQLARTVVAVLDAAAVHADSATPITPAVRRRLGGRDGPIAGLLQAGYEPELIAQAVADARARTERGVEYTLNQLARPGHDTKPTALDAIRAGAGLDR